MQKIPPAAFGGAERDLRAEGSSWVPLLRTPLVEYFNAGYKHLTPPGVKTTRRCYLTLPLSTKSFNCRVVPSVTLEAVDDLREAGGAGTIGCWLADGNSLGVA